MRGASVQPIESVPDLTAKLDRRVQVLLSTSSLRHEACSHGVLLSV